MKKVFIPLILLLLLAGVYVIANKATPPKQQQPVLVSSSPTVMQTTYCTAQDISAKISLDHAAGNVYGTFTMKNISQRDCLMQGSVAPAADYDMQTITNISVTYQGKPEKNVFTLAPNQTLYSQVHYPNGPQCGGPTKVAAVTFTYTNNEMPITFLNDAGQKEQQIQVCTTKSDITTIQIWDVSANPITN